MPNTSITIKIKGAAEDDFFAAFVANRPIPIELDPQTGEPPIDPDTNEPIITPLFTPEEWVEDRIYDYLFQIANVGHMIQIKKNVADAKDALKHDDLFDYKKKKNK